MIDFMKDYIKNNRVGQIANAHLALADRIGMDSDVCRSIAAKHSHAVDFPKTGQCPLLAPNERPKEWPDFMHKTKDTYRSKRVLGQLYRKADHVQKLGQLGQPPPVTLDPDLLLESRVEYTADAVKQRDIYDRKLGALMSEYGVPDEGELF